MLLRVGEAARAAGFDPRGVIPSPLLGPKGNREFLVHLVQGPMSNVQSLEAGQGPTGAWAMMVEACLAAAAADEASRERRA